MTQSSVEGREFRIRGRKVVCGVLVGMPVLMLMATMTILGPRPWILLPMLGMLAVLVAPVVVHALTSVYVFQGGVLTHRSAFGTKRLRLDQVRAAKVRTIRTKSGPSEQLTLTGPVTLRVSDRREDYPALRDAILAGLPPGVRPS